MGCGKGDILIVLLRRLKILVKMKKKSLFLCFGFLLLILLIGTVCSNLLTKTSYSKGEAEITAEEFITHAARQEIEKALEVSTGLVKYNLHNTKLISARAHVVLEVNTHIVTETHDMAIAQINIESINPLNEVSMHWYEVYLLREEDSWKVYKIEEVDPLIENKHAVSSNDDTEEALLIFQGFCEKIISKDYPRAGSYLIGRAKNNHELAGNMLTNAVITEGEVTINNAKSIMVGDKVMVLKIEYSIGSKKMRSIVSYYKTSRGWKIYNVSQI